MKNNHKVNIKQDECVKCGLCVKDCPIHAIEMSDSGAHVVMEDCFMCGHCLAICPKNIITISGFEDEPIELIGDTRVNSDKFLLQMKARRSVRFFTDEDVSMEMIMKIIEAGQYSPTATNRQGVSFVVLKDNKEEYEKIVVSAFRPLIKVARMFSKKFSKIEIDDNHIFKKAPVVIVIKSNDVVDGALAASAMEIMTQSLGLGVFYSGMFAVIANKSPKLKKMLKMSKKEKVVTALVIGHPDVKYKRTAPKERANILID